jgi:predicted metal-dependent hydrolase
MFKIYTININNKDYEIKITKRKNSSSLKLKYDLKTHKLQLSIPYFTTYAQGLDFVKSQNIWIETKVKSQQSNLINPSKIMCAGEYLDIIYKISAKNKITKHENKLLIEHNQNINPNELLLKFLKKQAKEYFTTISQEYAKKLNVSFEKVIITDSKSKWGSCSALKNLRYNFRLIMTPIFVIEYLIIHEVCHLVHFNHSSAFWDLLNSLTPHTKNAKLWLKNNITTLY